MYELRLPDFGEGLAEGEVARWLVAEGDEVREDDPLVEISTDKTTVEIPSPAAGRVSRILVAEGESVPVGTVLVVIGEPGAAVAGDGAGAAAAPAPGERRRERVRGVRRQVFEHVTRAHREVPAVTFVEECDFSLLEPALYLPAALRAAALALCEYPELNARLEGDEIVYLDRRDLGVAVQTDRGLLVPVVRAADTRSLAELRAEVDRLADGARAATLAPEELRGSTFTVTSAGKLGGLLVTPLVNHPEVAILGVHRVASRPVVRDGEVVVRPVGNVSVTFDHRVVDGTRAAAFALDVIARLEAGL